MAMHHASCLMGLSSVFCGASAVDVLIDGRGVAAMQARESQLTQSFRERSDLGILWLHASDPVLPAARSE